MSPDQDMRPDQTGTGAMLDVSDLDRYMGAPRGLPGKGVSTTRR